MGFLPAFVFLFVYTVCFPARGVGGVVINELYVDHPGADAGHEFVELYNTGPWPVPGSDVRIEFHNGSGGGWNPIWAGEVLDTLSPGGLYVVGGRFVDPLPRSVVELGLQNGPDAIRVVVGGVEADRVGYGGLDDPQWAERSGAPRVAPGRSIARIPDGRDSNDNSADFSDASPGPGRWNVARHDAAIGLRSPRVAMSGASIALTFRVWNAGVFPADSVRVILSDSLGGIPPAEALLGRSLPPADTADVTFHVVASRMYLTLRARLELPGDEVADNDTVRAYRRARDPRVRVSEVWPSPSAGCPQFVELYNGGPDPVDPTGWALRDAVHDPVRTGGTARRYPPGAFVVLTPDSTALVGCFGVRIARSVVPFAGAWPTLNRTGFPVADSIVAYDRWGLVLDRVSYPAPDAGRSIERANLSTDGPPLWAGSAEPEGASPGRAGQTVWPGDVPRGGLTVSPNPFRPRAGEVLRVAVSSREERDGGARVDVYDTAGRHVAALGGVRRLPAVFVWDGARDADGVIRPGLYVVRCRLQDRAGTVTANLREVVGCASR